MTDQTPHRGLTPLEHHVMQIGQVLGRLEGKIDRALDAAADQSKVLDDHEQRLRGLERTGWKQWGILVGASAVVSFLVNHAHKLGVLPQ